MPGDERRQPDLELLSALTLAHTQAIPFENLNPLSRRPVPLDLESLEAKLVRSARGGYCFEQNTYFAAVLEQLGYSVRRLAARVVWGASAEPPWNNPRTHMALLVDIDGRQFLCDVGFGGVTPTAPLPFEPGQELATPHETFRILERGEIWLLQVRIEGEWQDVYLFDLQPQSAIDYQMANHYVATHPTSHFRFTLTAARAFEGGRHHLRNRLLTSFYRDSAKQQRVLSGTSEIAEVLQQVFGIDCGDKAQFESALGNISEDDT